MAILLVLVWHYIACQLPAGAAPAWLGGLLSVTWSGVDLFFVLSGFLIVGNLLDAKGTPGYFRRFYLRRACRILPLYYLVLGLFVVLQQFGGADNEWLLAPRLPLLSYYTFTQNFFMHQLGFGPNWLGVTWSLAVEEQFYLVVPLLVWVLGRRRLAWVFGAAVLLAPVWRLAAGNLGAYVFPWARADAILLGGLIALLVRSASGWLLVAVSRRGLAVALGTLLTTVMFLVHKQAGVGDVYLHFLLALTYGVVLLLTLAGGGGLGGRVLTWLGLRSYGIYLFHQPVSGLVHKWLTGSSVPSWGNRHALLAQALSLLLLMALSEFSYRYFEAVFLRYGRRFQPGRVAIWNRSQTRKH